MATGRKLTAGIYEARPGRSSPSPRTPPTRRFRLLEGARSYRAYARLGTSDPLIRSDATPTDTARCLHCPFTYTHTHLEVCVFFPGAQSRDTETQSVLLTLRPPRRATSFTHEVLMFLN